MANTDIDLIRQGTGAGFDAAKFLASDGANFFVLRRVTLADVDFSAAGLTTDFVSKFNGTSLVDSRISDDGGTVINIDSQTKTCLIGDVNSAGSSTLITIDDSGKKILLAADEVFLSNYPTNGLVQTTGGTGVLSIIATTALPYLPLAGGALTGAVTLTLAPGANTIIAGFSVVNSTAATSGNQQYSPQICWVGEGFKTLGSVSRTVKFCAYVVPTQGTPTAEWILSYDLVVLGTPIEVMRVSSISNVSATTFNNVNITVPATTAVLTLSAGKTITFQKTLNFTGTDSTTMTFPTTSATIARIDTGQTFLGANIISISDSANAFLINNTETTGFSGTTCSNMLVPNLPNTKTAYFGLGKQTGTNGLIAYFGFKYSTTTVLNAFTVGFWGYNDVFAFYPDGQLSIGTTTAPTGSPTNVLRIGLGTEPSNSPADQVMLYSYDLSAANNTLGLRTETAVATETALTADRSLSIRINGATLKLLCHT